VAARRLNDLPEVRHIVADRFHGEPISKQNLSRWRQGGFRDWQARQEALASPAAPPPNLDLMVEVLARHYARRANARLAEQAYGSDLKLLHACCMDIPKLRRYQIQVARLKIDQRCLCLLQPTSDLK
jgi:hypothetical protein